MLMRQSPRPRISRRRSPASWSCSPADTTVRMSRSACSRSAIAESTALRPASVRDTRMPRPSFGSVRRATSPRAVSRSTRFVIVPLDTMVCCSRVFGLSSNGSPARRRADRTSNSHGSMPLASNAARRARSRWRASRSTRESTCSGAKSRSSRCRPQAATIRSTSSWSGIRPSWPVGLRTATAAHGPRSTPTVRRMGRWSGASVRVPPWCNGSTTAFGAVRSGFESWRRSCGTRPDEHPDGAPARLAG